MADETPETIKRYDNYIDNAGTSAAIHGWGGPFLIWLPQREGVPEARGISLQRHVCFINGDAFAGKAEFALVGVYNSEQDALNAIRASPAAVMTDTLAYAFYRGPEDVILPTIISSRTAPRLTAALEALIREESNDAKAAIRTLIEAFLTIVPLRGAGVPVTRKIPRPPVRGVPEPPPPATPVPPIAALPKGEITAAEMLKLVQHFWRNSPLLQDLYLASKADPAQRHAKLIVILKAFIARANLTLQVVKNGEVQAATRPKNFSSLRMRPGSFVIEEQAYNNAAVLIEELRHEIAYFEAGMPVTQPVLARIKLTDFLEMMAKEGEAKVTSLLMGL